MVKISSTTSFSAMFESESAYYGEESLVQETSLETTENALHETRGDSDLTRCDLRLVAPTVSS